MRKMRKLLGYLLVAAGAVALLACDPPPDSWWTSVVEGDNEDGDDDDGDGCLVEISASGFSVDLEGDCQPPDAPCEGGTVPEMEQGDCNQGQVCCIDTDMCENMSIPMVSPYCQDSECEFGFQVGCPDQGWCCIEAPFKTAPSRRDQ